MYPVCTCTSTPMDISSYEDQVSIGREGGAEEGERLWRLTMTMLFPRADTARIAKVDTVKNCSTSTAAPVNMKYGRRGGRLPFTRAHGHESDCMLEERGGRIAVNVVNTQFTSKKCQTRGETRRCLLLTAFTAIVAPAVSTSATEDITDTSILHKEQREVEQLRSAMNLFQTALNANGVEEEEAAWTQLISEFRNTDYVWTVELVSRALGNRGNARSRQGRQKQAIEDYDESIAMTDGKQADPILNRGVAHESLLEFDLALADYRAVLDLDPDDPSA